MAIDNPTPLVTVSQFQSGPFADLTSNFSPAALNDLVLEATRVIEDQCQRRLAPFTNITESGRAISTDVEDVLQVSVPVLAQAQMNMDYAQALGYPQLVRHYWLNEFPPRYQEMWTTTLNSITIYWSFGATVTVDPSTVEFQPETGHMRFLLGTFVPPGSTISVTYSGGYQTVPASLRKAAAFMAGSIALKELEPGMSSSGHDPDMLRMEAIELAAPFAR
jgi:hypothetical protein